jgi:hypothetical protein
MVGNSAKAQQVFGNIYGTITDASGGAVTNAKVTITDTSKGTQFVVMSDASGNYAKGQLIPDSYVVTIEAPGFQKTVSNGLVVRVDEAARFDAALKIGESKEVVEVTAAAPLLQTDRADVAQTFDTKQISELPNIGRNTQSMELLNPGTAKLGWQHASDENPQGSVQMVANGQLFDSMGYELDGTIRFWASLLSIRRLTHLPKSKWRSRTSTLNSNTSAAALLPTPPSLERTRSTAMRLNICS